MNEGNDAGHGRRRRAGSPRAGVPAVAAAGIALLAAACGGVGSSAAAGSAAYQDALPFAQCMRSHGEPSWPDPSSAGTFSTSQIDINSAQVSSALSACKSLQPATGTHLQLSAAQQQALLERGLKIAGCMRGHGVTSFPDPEVQAAQNGGISFSTQGLAPGQKPSSPQFLAAQKACFR